MTLRAGMFAVFAALCGATAWYNMLTGFSDWDDEGYLLLTVKQFLDGHRLYDEIWTVYGPVYYGWEAVLYRVTRLAPGNDAGRMFSVIAWVLVPLGCAWMVWRVTRRWEWAAVTHVATSANLWLFTNEPGHPQEICLVLLVLLGAVLVEERRARAMACAAGALVAALALTKINAGVLTGAAVAVTLTLGTARGGRAWVRWMTAAAVGGALAIPTVLTRGQWSEGWVRYWWAMGTASMGCALAVVVWRRAEAKGEVRRWWLAAGAAVVGAAAIVAPFLMLGTTLGAVVRMTVVRMAGFSGLFSAPLGFDGWSLVSAGGSMAAVGLYLAGWRVGRWLWAAKVAMGAGTIVAVLLGYPSHALEYAWPWVWLVAASEDGVAAWPRVGLCVLTAVQVLYAFPVAGSQAPFAATLLTVTAAVCLADVSGRVRVGAGWRRAGAVAAAVAVLGGHIYYLVEARSDYGELVSLDLPGARRVRVDAETRDTYHWLVDQIGRNCSGFVTMPGLNSFYFWTEQASPTLVTGSDWVGVLDEAEQQRMVNDFARVERPCVVYNPAIVDFWIRGGRKLPRRAMVRYIEEHFARQDGREDWQFLTPKKP